MSNTEQQNTAPFLEDVINFLRPQIVEERRNVLLKMVVDWVVAELRTYAHNHSTDDVTCEVELHKCRSKLMIEGVEEEIYGYQLLITIKGTEPQHPDIQADCFFKLDGDQITNLFLSGDRPDGTPGNVVQ